MQAHRSINVTEFIDSHRLAPFQILIVVLCFLIVAIDGFDTAAIGFIAPAIRAEWSLTPGQLAPLFGAGLTGLMAGAFLFDLGVGDGRIRPSAEMGYEAAARATAVTTQSCSGVIPPGSRCLRRRPWPRSAL